MSCEFRGKERSPEIVALIMAAGVSRRFGSDKRRARLDDGRTLLETTLATASQVYPRCWLVIRPEDDLGEALVAYNDLLRMAAPHAGNGLGGSLGDAFRELISQQDNAVAAAVILADMPWLNAATCSRLNRHAGPARIVMPRHQGKRGHPVLFGRDLWPALAELKEGEGARGVVQANRQAVHVIDVDDAGIWRDVDTPRDLEAPV